MEKDLAKMQEQAKVYDIGNFKTDEDKETDGVWFDYDTPLRVKVARLGNTKYQAYMEKKYGRQLDKLINGSLPKTQADEMMTDGMSRYILVDWENMGEGGKPVSFSQEKAAEFLHIKDFRDEILAFSRQRERYTREVEAIAGKNL